MLIEVTLINLQTDSSIQKIELDSRIDLANRLILLTSLNIRCAKCGDVSIGNFYLADEELPTKLCYKHVEYFVNILGKVKYEGSSNETIRK